MTPDDRSEFSAMLFGLAAVFDADMSPTKSQLYFQALADYTLDEIREAGERWLRRGKFFPKPVELREHAAVVRKDRAPARPPVLPDRPKLTASETREVRDLQALWDGRPLPGRSNAEQREWLRKHAPKPKEFLDALPEDVQREETRKAELRKQYQDFLTEQGDDGTKH